MGMKLKSGPDILTDLTLTIHYGVFKVHSTLHSMGYIFWCANQIITKFLLDLDQDKMPVW